MKRSFIHLLVFALAAGNFSSCRKKESAEPVITFTGPASGSVFSPGDTIHVEADISDDNELATATLKLLNSFYTPVDHQESFSINASSFHLTFDYVIENAYLETGNYFIALTTTDGDHDRNEFRTIVIQEIPKTTKGVYVLTRPDSSRISVSKIDSSGQISFQFDVPGDYSGSAINSRYNQLVTAGTISGAFSQYDLDNYSVVHTIPPYAFPLPSFGGVYFSHYYSFVSYYDGRIRAFDKDGSVKFNSDQPVFYQPGTLCINDKYVFAEAYYPGTGDTRLVVINYPSGIARQEFNIGADIVSMLNREDNEIIIFGNSSADGKIYLYDVISNSMNDLHTLFGNPIFSAINIESDRYAIATSAGLYSYEESMNNLVPVDLSEPVYSLEYDEVNGILYVNAGNKIKEYAFPDPLILNTTMSLDSVVDVRVLYSK